MPILHRQVARSSKIPYGLVDKTKFSQSNMVLHMSNLDACLEFHWTQIAAATDAPMAEWEGTRLSKPVIWKPDSSHQISPNYLCKRCRLYRAVSLGTHNKEWISKIWFMGPRCHYQHKNHRYCVGLLDFINCSSIWISRKPVLLLPTPISILIFILHLNSNHFRKIYLTCQRSILDQRKAKRLPPAVFMPQKFGKVQ